MARFSPFDASRILNAGPEAFGALLSEAARQIGAQVASRVLIIEDEPLIAMDLEALVEGLGHSVVGNARTRDEAANTLLDEALAELAEKMAREEALLRTFEASGKKSVDEFADMYGMDPRAVLRSLHNARTRAAAAEAAAIAAAVAEAAEPETAAEPTEPPVAPDAA